MRRVVVTGLGIVSSIGGDAAEVTASLRQAKSGISFSPDFAEHGFKCQVWGKPSLDPTDLVDRRAMRFLSQGGAWNHVAMKQAIADSGLEESDISGNERTGIIMGSGGPSTRTIVEAADITLKNNSPKRIGPFAVPKAMSSTASATNCAPITRSSSSRTPCSRRRVFPSARPCSTLVTLSKKTKPTRCSPIRTTSARRTTSWAASADPGRRFLETEQDWCLCRARFRARACRPSRRTRP